MKVSVSCLRFAITSLALFVAAGCGNAEDRYGPLLPVRYETDAALIGTSFDDPLCEGDLVFVDEQIRRLAEMFDVKLEEPVRIDLYGGIPVGCSPGAMGCFLGSHISTHHSALGHELVHAVAIEVGRPEKFWREATAEALSERPMKRRSPEYDLAAAVRQGESGYDGGGHAVRWLIGWGGEDAFRDFYATEDLAAAYGVTLEEASAISRVEAAWFYASAFSCSAPELATEDGEGLDAVVEVDCARPDATRFGVGGRTAAQRSFSLQSGGTYVLEVEGGYGVAILGCEPTDIAEPRETNWRGDVYTETQAAPLNPVFVSGQQHRLQLEPGPYLLTVMSDDVQESTRIRLELEP